MKSPCSAYFRRWGATNGDLLPVYSFLKFNLRGLGAEATMSGTMASSLLIHGCWSAEYLALRYLFLTIYSSYNIRISGPYLSIQFPYSLSINSVLVYFYLVLYQKIAYHLDFCMRQQQLRNILLKKTSVNLTWKCRKYNKNIETIKRIWISKLE